MPEHELHSVTVALRYQYTTYTDERHNNAEEKGEEDVSVYL